MNGAAETAIPTNAWIRRRLGLVILGTTITALLFTSIAFSLYDFLTVRQATLLHLETLGRIVASNSTAALAFSDRGDAQEVLNALKNESQIVAAVLYDPDGYPFASFPEKPPGPALPAAPGEPGYAFARGFLEGFQPVVQGRDFNVGTLYLRADTSAIYERLKLYGAVAFLVLAGSVLVAFLVARRLQGQITLPFGHVVGKLRAQLGRVELLNRITRAISERQDPPSIFKVVLRNLEDDLPIDFGCICLYEPAARTLKVASVGAGSEGLARDVELTEGSHIAAGENGLARCLRGSLVYEPVLRGVDSALAQQLVGAGLSSLVIAPLLAESTIFGVVLAARRDANGFTSSECEFIRQLSEHVALASHQTQLYAELQAAYDDLRQSQQTVLQQERLRALGQMASGIAHDINNAISPVTLYTESLLEREPNLSERARDQLRTIQRAIDDVARTVSRMREFYRAREPQLMLTQVDLNSLVRQVIDLTRARWSDQPLERGLVIELSTQLEADLPAIMGAENEIRDALTNLIFNAADAMPGGGTLTLRTRIITWDLPGDAPLQHVAVEVRDTGVGMDEETRRRCLEPFYTTKGERGTGLGLAMVFGMVKRHSADLEIESTPGQGTLARLIFPVPMISARVAQSSRPLPSVRPLRILIVDDDPLLLKSLREILEADGHQVSVAEGGQAAIDAFAAAKRRGESFTAVITDLGMPYVDGRKVASSLRAQDPDVPIVMLTGWGQRLIEDNDLPDGVSRVLSKPPRLHELRAAFAELAP